METAQTENCKHIFTDTSAEIAEKSDTAAQRHNCGISQKRLPENSTEAAAAPADTVFIPPAVPAEFAAVCTPRAADSHKGSFGTLGVIGGAEGMTGAAVLAGSAALKNGCGKVWLGFMQEKLPLPVIETQPELMLATAQNLSLRRDISAWVIGCGMDTHAHSQHFFGQWLAGHDSAAAVFDADALNILAKREELAQQTAGRSGISILTPHPAEAARLLACSTQDIQADRSKNARRLAQKFRAWIVLKGHGSLIAAPDGSLRKNPTGNPALATAGSGDVLAGIIGALLAQGTAAEEAVAGGVWLHGAAADLWAEENGGTTGMTAGEIAVYARKVRNLLIKNRKNGTADTVG